MLTMSPPAADDRRGSRGTRLVHRRAHRLRVPCRSRACSGRRLVARMPAWAIASSSSVVTPGATAAPASSSTSAATRQALRRRASSSPSMIWSPTAASGGRCRRRRSGDRRVGRPHRPDHARSHRRAGGIARGRRGSASASPGCRTSTVRWHAAGSSRRRPAGTHSRQARLSGRSHSAVRPWSEANDRTGQVAVASEVAEDAVGMRQAQELGHFVGIAEIVGVDHGTHQQ